MPVFRPSMLVNIVLSFDEQLTLKAPPVPEAVEDYLADPPDQSDSLQAMPAFFQATEQDKSFILGKVPKSCEVELPGYRQAGSFHATFDYAELPIDPRCIRSASVEIHLGTVSHQDFSDGFKSRRADGSLSSVLTPRRDDGAPNSSTLLIVATVDEWHVDHGEEGSVAILSGRDLRGILLDTPIGILPGATQQLFDELDMNQPIDAIVTQILKFNPMYENFQVVVNPAEWKDGVVPSPANSDVVPRHRKPAKAHTKKTAQGPKQKVQPRVSSKAGSNDLSFWDLIVRTCFMVGAIPYFRGTRLYIRPARSAFDQLRVNIDPARNPTPFAGGLERRLDLVAGAPMLPPLKIRRLVYGRDVLSYGFDRKFAGFHRPRVVRVVGYDASAPNGQRVIEARWPPEEVAPPKVTKTSPSGKQAQEEILNIPVGDITDPAQLEEMARGVYEEIGRGEIGGTVTTENLASFGGDNTDPDLLRLAPGDGVEMLVDTRAISDGSELTSLLTELNRLSFAEAVKRVSEKLGRNSDLASANLATAIVGTQRGQFAELQAYFRVANVRYNWDEEGVKISFDYQNYIVPRNQVGRASTAPGSLQVSQVPGRGKAGTTPSAGPKNKGGLSALTGRH